MASQDFEEAYASPCDCGGENLSWEWDGNDLVFRATCSCLKSYSLVPVGGVVEITDEEAEESDDDS